MVRLGSTPVLDFGSFSVKAGFAGESYPLLVFTQEQFHPKSWPIVRGKIEDWQLFEQMIQTIWGKLRVDPSEEEVILVEHSGTAPEEHKKMEVLMFEKFKVRYLTFLPAALCTSQAAGVPTGIMVNFGHGVTRISVVIDNVAKKEVELPLGGQDSTSHLATSLQTRHPDQGDLTIHSREIKERHSFASLNPALETEAVGSTAKSLQRTYTMPNETEIVLDRERASCIEPIFSSIKGSGDDTVASITKQFINDFPERSADLAQNIVICGGPTNCTNFNYRLLSELYKCKASKIVRIFCPPERTFTCWVGASVIYFDDDYVDQGMSLSEYNYKYLQAEQ